MAFEPMRLKDALRKKEREREREGGRRGGEGRGGEERKEKKTWANVLYAVDTVTFVIYMTAKEPLHC